MASSNEVPKPTVETEMGHEKDQNNFADRSRNSQKKSKRSSKKSSTKKSSTISPSGTDQRPPEHQKGDTSLRPKPRSRSASLMRKLSIGKREKKAEGNTNRRDDCATKSIKSDSGEIYLAPESNKSNDQNSSVPEVFSNSAESMSLTSKGDKGPSKRPPIQQTSNSPGENQENPLKSKWKKSAKISESASIRKKIAINTGGKSVAFEYVADKPDLAGTVAAIYKASMSPKAARKLFGRRNPFKKESSTVSKTEKENGKQVSKSIWKTKIEKIMSEERKNDTANTTTHSSNTPKIEEEDIPNSKFDSSTLARKNISGESSSSVNDTVDGTEHVGKTKDSSECININEEVNNTLIDNDIVEKNTLKTAKSDNPFHDIHTLNEGNLHQNRDTIQQAVTGESYANSTEKLETQDVINSSSTEAGVHNKLEREKSFSRAENVNIDLASSVLEINYHEIEQTDVSKSPALEDIQGEMTEDKIESTAVNSNSNKNLDDPSQKDIKHPPNRIKLERDNSRLQLGKIFEKKSTEVEQNPGEEDIPKAGSESALTTSSRLDHEDQHRDDKFSSKPGFLRNGIIRATRKSKKGNVRTIEGQGEFLVKYMRVHGESEKAYKNESEPRGLIFMKNMESFSSGTYAERNGSREDYKNLLSLFSQMGYIPAGNLCESGVIKKEKLIKDLKTFAKMSHKIYDSTIIIIMSHGVDDKTFVTSDEKEVQLSKMYSILNSNNCSSLKGKPKIFIFQFCRPAATKRCSVQIENATGERLKISIAKPEKKTDIRKMLLNFLTISKSLGGSDQSINDPFPSQLDVILSEESEPELDEEDELTEAIRPGMEQDSKVQVPLPGLDLTPDNSDMYSIFATQAGGVAYRDPKKGSLLIQAICDVFSKHAYQDDIDALVRKVSLHVQNKITGIQSQDAGPCRPGVVERVNSGLDKLFYFNPYPRGVMKDGMLIDTNLLALP